jgi:hypothetical protein
MYILVPIQRPENFFICIFIFLISSVVLIHSYKASFIDQKIKAQILKFPRPLNRNQYIKRPFILIEIMIAVSLLAICAIPLVSSSIITFKTRKKQFTALELERKGELLFYQFLKEELSTVNFEQISKAKEKIKDFKTFILSIDDQKITFYPHYHLFHAHKHAPQEMMKATCKICISKEKGKCSDPYYLFEFFAKKVAEKSVNTHVGEKENPLVEANEKSPRDLQTIHPSKREPS